jgi:hypothetical protein
MPDKTDEDNVVYLNGKPGFYKKGPGQFKLSFGSLEDLVEKAREDSELKVVPDEPDESA